MKTVAVLLLSCCAAWGHVISMSNGYATVSGNRVDYILRMPDYELPHATDPTRVLLDHIRFTSGFETARRTEGECHHDAAQASYLCAATYVFSLPPGQLAVTCSLFEVTVPNHIHMLHAQREGKSDQAILDSSFPSADLLFRPPTAVERAVTEIFEAAKRTLTTWAQLLLLAALALASRGWRELLVCTLTFLLFQCAICMAVIAGRWRPSAQLSEEAVALALAYLGFEILVFPKSGGRWMIAALFGAFGGMYYASFISESGYGPVWVLSGSALAWIVGMSLTLPSFKLGRYRDHIGGFASIPLLLTGCGWFYIRLKG